MPRSDRRPALVRHTRHHAHCRRWHPLGRRSWCGLSHPDIVISQVYGGGGTSPGSTVADDYIELFTRGTSAVSLAGWSVQYASATGTGNFGGTDAQITLLPSVMLSPGQYLLIQGASTAGGTALPVTPDVTDATPINLSGTNGKVAVARIATSLGCNGGSTPCDAGQLANIVDLIGYGSANFFEGAAAPVLSTTTAALRAAGGCQTRTATPDFAAPHHPRNSATAAITCGGPSPTPTAPGQRLTRRRRRSADATPGALRIRDIRGAAHLAAPGRASPPCRASSRSPLLSSRTRACRPPHQDLRLHRLGPSVIMGDSVLVSVPSRSSAPAARRVRPGERRLRQPHDRPDGAPGLVSRRRAATPCHGGRDQRG
jgi:hypothetical protein